MKTKICLRCGKEFIPTGSNQKYCSDCKVKARKKYYEQWCLAHTKQIKEHNKQYYKDNTEKLKETATQWAKNSPEQKKEYNKQYRKDNPEWVKKWRKQYYKNHTEKVKESIKQYLQTPAGKEVHKRQNAKRRQLDFITLNKWFEGCVGHHMNKIFVVYIPEWLHRSIAHNIWTGQGMAEINFKVLQFLMGGV